MPNELAKTSTGTIGWPVIAVVQGDVIYLGRGHGWIHLRSLIGQAHVVLGQRHLCCAVFSQMGQFGMLDVVIKFGLIREMMQKFGHVPAEPLGFPDAGEGGVGIAFKRRLILVVIEFAGSACQR